MLMPILKSVAQQRADISRTIEYMKEMASDEPIGSRILEVEAATQPMRETAEEKDAKETISQLTCESDETYDEEIERILKANNNLSFDQMIGI